MSCEPSGNEERVGAIDFINIYFEIVVSIKRIHLETFSLRLNPMLCLPSSEKVAITFPRLPALCINGLYTLSSCFYYLSLDIYDPIKYLKG